MLKSRKHVFWEALLVTILIFGIGVFLGVVLENSRAKKASDLYSDSDLNLLDVRIQTQVLDLKDLNCDSAIEKNIEFGDRIFEDAKIIERYEIANRLTDEIVEVHKKYDLLRTSFWANSIKIKEMCGEKFNTVVYLYDYNSEDIEQKSRQKVFSRFLGEIKEKYGNKIILIPIAKNLNIASLELLTEKYNLSQTTIIIDEKNVITKIEDLDNIEKFLK